MTTPPEAQGRFGGRLAVIAGASRGLGAAVARRLAEDGAQVVLIARTQGALEKLDDEIRASTGRRAILAPFDLTDGAQIDRLGQTLYERFGKLDILVSTAAQLGVLSPIGHVDPPDWDKTLALNLTANWRLIRSLDPLLRLSDAGRAVFATAQQAREATAYWGPYAVSKAALEALVRVYAAEVAHTGLRVNLVDPGPFKSRLRTQAFPGENPDILPDPLSLADRVLDLLTADCKRNGELVAPR